MAKSRNNPTSLVNRLISANVNRLGSPKSLAPGGLFGASPAGTAASGKPPSIHESKFLSISAKDVASGIQFGHPSNAKTPATTPSGSAWTSLLKQSASGGVGSVLSGGLSSIAGLGGLVSGIMSLFGGGGKSTPPPLIEFQLPGSVSQTLYVGSKGSTAYQGNVVETQSTSGTGGNQASGSPSLSNQGLQYQSAAIAQAVKTALLHSSSLNDVIAEI